MNVTNPATGKSIGEVPEDTPETMAAKHAAARDAQPRWAAVPLPQRIAALRRFRDGLVERKEELARTLTAEVGKPIRQSWAELDAMPGRIDFFLENVAALVEDTTVHAEPSKGLEERVAYEPLGVVANISAWNYPYFVGSNVFVPALLTGNAVLYKPSELASLTGRALADLMADAGVPRDVFTPVFGAGTVAAQLLTHPLDGVFFTGSHATGRKVAEAAGRGLMRMQLELGGKDPVYVCGDADLEHAAPSVAVGAFYNSGQSCCAVERIYVHQRIHDAFVDAFLKSVRAFVVGDPTDEATFIGPVTRRAQLDVLEAQVADARGKGALVLLGGRRLEGPGSWFEPTVLSGVDHRMELMREESFGPVIGIQEVRDDDEALALMNDTRYGLTSGVYSKDRDRATRILSAVRSGSVYWNCCDRVSPRLPWSGRGDSGIGATLGLDGIRAFVQPKAWHLRSARGA
jgi:acyl-CoA reductase-like NAD-dependent aldehyde dehydrogenase